MPYINKPLLIFIVLTILYILSGHGVTISNDSVTNVDQITDLDLWSRSSHFSFHFFGIIFYLVFSSIIGLSAVTSIEIMLALFGAAGSVSLYLISIKKYNNISQAIITVLIYSIASGIFRFACQVEYLILVPSLGLISLYFYTRGQNLFAGLTFGFAILTSPFAVLMTPMFLLFTSFKELFKKHNIIFAVSTVAIYLIVNLFTYEETVSGHWSYGGIFNLYKELYSQINVPRTAAIYIYGYLRSFNIIILILPFVLYYLYKSDKELLYVFILTIFIHLPTAIPEARYGGYQMTAYPVIAIAIGLYFSNVLIKRKYLVVILTAFFIITNFYIVYTERSFFRDLKDTYVQLNNNLDKNSVLIVYQASKPIKEVYAPDLQVIDLLTDYQNERAKIIPGFIPTDLSSVINNNDTVYLLESGVSMPDDHLKLLVGQFTKSQGAKVKGFALGKVLAKDSSLQIVKLENYPLDVYRFTKRYDE
ncbi:MAG TPA: hypothetical protein VLH59_05625 [Ignavibacteriaceae bacterium]|nr:hypothetical protein [Ignavibacteriaceae bacterium]